MVSRTARYRAPPSDYPPLMVRSRPEYDDDSTSGDDLSTVSSIMSTEKVMRPLVKVLRVTETWCSETRRYVESNDMLPSKPKRRESSPCIFKRTQRFRHNGRVLTRVSIHGDHIRKILKELSKEDDGPSFRKGEKLEEYDLKLMYHYRHILATKLEQAVACTDTNAEPDLIFEIEAALDLIQDEFADKMLELTQLPEGETTYDLLWTFFPPRSLVATKDDHGQLEVLRVRKATYVSHRDGTQEGLEIEVDYVSFDGEKTGFVEVKPLMIAPFKSSRPILKLDYYPFDLAPSADLERQALLERAERIMRLHGQHVQEYRGYAADAEGRRLNSHRRVVLDPKTLADVKHHDSSLVPCIASALNELTEEHKILLSPVLYGFSFENKVWGKFAVSSLQDVEWNTEMMDALALPTAQKDFIRTLVESHASNGFGDIVRGKGNGLVGLLSGPPGVGKTLTAEAVAEVARRPLYTITSGELGSTPESVESRLNKIMELAEAWNAVVLLDEADIFLMERDNVSLKRNAITSIFLRRLEYYHGIMILTSNRPKSFDPAFTSRIHFALEYPDLDDNARRSVWQTFIDRAKRDGRVTVDISLEEMDQLVAIPLNGRQIKNIMNITQTVAAQKGLPISMEGVQLALGFSHHISK